MMMMTMIGDDDDTDDKVTVIFLHLQFFTDSKLYRDK